MRMIMTPEDSDVTVFKSHSRGGSKEKLESDDHAPERAVEGALARRPCRREAVAHAGEAWQRVSRVALERR